jgi:hypothetical protein
MLAGAKAVMCGDLGQAAADVPAARWYWMDRSPSTMPSTDFSPVGSSSAPAHLAMPLMR